MRNWSSQATPSADVAERAVEGKDPGSDTCVDHAGDRVVPQILLVCRPFGIRCIRVRVVTHHVVGMAAADAGRLHPTIGGEVGRPEGQTLHAGRREADLLDVGDAASGLQDRMDQQRLGQTGLGFELGEEPIDVVDVFRSLHLRNHDHVERIAGLDHRRRQIVEPPWRIEAVDAGPELRVAEVDVLCDVDEASPRGILVRGGDAVLEVGEQHVDLADHARHLAAHLLVRCREEVDHPARPERDLVQGRRRTDGERLEEVLGGTHDPTLPIGNEPVASRVGRCAVRASAVTLPYRDGAGPRVGSNGRLQIVHRPADIPAWTNRAATAI